MQPRPSLTRLATHLTLLAVAGLAWLGGVRDAHA